MTDEIIENAVDEIATSYYAADGLLSTAPIDGGIEIAEEEYQTLLEAVVGGGRVKVVNGAAVVGSTKRVTVYSTTDGSPSFVYGDEPVTIGFTMLQPALGQTWNGSAWAFTGNDAILHQIDQLEGSVTPRRMREALLGDDSWLVNVNQQIATLRGTLTA